MSANNLLHVSFIIPYYNAERSVFEIYNSISNNIRTEIPLFEIIVIDDCSDKVVDNAELQLIKSTGNLFYERLNKNKGQSYATGLGVSKSKGNILITLDDDLIYSTAFLLSCISYFKENNFDTLYCVRNTNAQHSFIRRFIVNVLKWIIYFFTKKRVSSIRIMNAKIGEQITACIDMQYFSIDKIIYRLGNTIGFMKVDVLSIGKTRYNFIKLTSVLKQYIGFKI